LEESQAKLANQALIIAKQETEIQESKRDKNTWQEFKGRHSENYICITKLENDS
jgi:hypothetical protein